MSFRTHYTAVTGSNSVYFPGLNGLRAISALVVLFAHITMALGEIGLDPQIFGSLTDGRPQALSLAGYGVTMFFVLSGFLITFLLLEERERSGGIVISKFYMRRILRIWPLYYLYLFILVFLGWFSLVEMNTQSLLFYVFLLANVPLILDTSIPLLAHFWSIGVEEQFYLIWPWLLSHVKNLSKIILALIVVLFGTKTLLHFISPNSIAETAIHITRFHVILVGALAAVYYKQNRFVFIQLFSHWVVQLLAWSVILLSIVDLFPVSFFMANEVIALVSAVLIIGQITRSGVSLDRSILNYLGKISYGIYIIHPILIFAIIRLIDFDSIHPAFFRYVSFYAITTVFTLLFAHLSYHFFEKFFLAYKQRYSVVSGLA